MNGDVPHEGNKDGEAVHQDDISSSVYDAIKVFIRIRPLADDTHLQTSRCIGGVSSTSLAIEAKPVPKQFTFDHVADEQTTQDNVFNHVGKPTVDNCIKGYNGTIFAYGQTGSGKTYTMIGPNDNFTADCQRQSLGIIPRCLEYLFHLISNKIQIMGEDRIEFLCKCSFLEIYNEHVYDLLDASPTSSLHLRESIKRGVFVDGIVETIVTSAVDALKVLSLGWNNRHVAATSMNRESSRSHAVFTVSIESKERSGDVQKLRQSLLNLVDLAGSERQKDTNTTGLRLREAGSINRSLSVLGNVVMSLGDIARGKARHAPYRDSKLTFLLRDSIGGNSKTFIIANINPSTSCFGETLSTLYFAQRAKLIRNKVRVNENSQGDIAALQREIRRLKSLLASVKSSPTSDDVENAGSSASDDGARFFRAMQLWKRDMTQMDELRARLTAADTVKRKSDRALMSLRMIVKFRDAKIKSMMTSSSSVTSSSSRDEEIAALKKEIDVLNDQLSHHPEVTSQLRTIERLERDIARLQSLPQVANFLQLSEDKKKDLCKEFQKLQNENRSIDKSSTDVSSLQETANEDNSNELNEIRQEKAVFEKEIICLKATVRKLEGELTGCRLEKQELDNVLKASQETQRLQVEHLNSIHDTTIRSLTPIKSSDQKRRRFHPDCGSAQKRFKSINSNPVFQLLSGSPSNNDGDNHIGDSGGFRLEDEQDVNVEANNLVLLGELEAERASKAQVEKELQAANRQSIDLRQQLANLQQKLAASEEERSVLREQNSAQQEKLEGERQRAKTMTRDCEIHTLEIRDLRILIKSADREIAEKKSDFAVEKDKLSKKIGSLEQQLTSERASLAASVGEAERSRVETMRLEGELETCCAELNYARHECAESRADVAFLRASCDAARADIDAYAGELEELRRSAEGNSKEHEAAREELRSANKILREELDDAVERNASYEERVERLESELKSSDTAIASNKVAMTSLLEQVTELKREKECEVANAERLCGEIEERKMEISALNQENEKLRAEVEAQLKIAKETREEFELKDSARQFELDNLQDDLASFTDQYALLERELERREEEVEREKCCGGELRKQLEQERSNRADLVADLERKLQQERRTRQMEDEEKTQLESDLEERTDQFKRLKSSFDVMLDDYQKGRERIASVEEKLEEKDRVMTQLIEDHNAETTKLIKEKIAIQRSHEEAVESRTCQLSMKVGTLSQIRDKLEAEVDDMRAALDECERRLHASADQVDLKAQQVERLENLSEENFHELHRVRSQLEEENHHRLALQQKIDELSAENKKLIGDVTTLAGHNNQKQKIQYLRKMRKEIFTLTDQRNVLQSRCDWQAEQLRIRDPLLLAPSSAVKSSRSKSPSLPAAAPETEANGDVNPVNDVSMTSSP